MIVQAIRLIRQLIDWRRAKRCRRSRHKWDEFPYKPGIVIQSCRWCGAQFFRRKDRAR